MNFDSLSEAILYYSGAGPYGTNYPPYGELASQTGQMPLNTNYIQEALPNVIRYGVTLWGQSKIIEVSKATV